MALRRGSFTIPVLYAIQFNTAMPRSQSGSTGNQDRHGHGLPPFQSFAGGKTGAVAEHFAFTMMPANLWIGLAHAHNNAGK